ncbi:MAG: hypothetical protein KAV87_12860 [Desulfobacteraceae bacterium]|nr:hypothetical protein [Desulfobacteraceae bacterium]
MKNKILKATHSGELEIGDLKIPCFVLEDGTRVISQTGVVKALGLNRFVQLGVFIQRKALKSFVSKELTVFTKNPILFTPPRGGKAAYGFRAVTLADLCEVILEANKKDIFTDQQMHIVRQCQILAQAFMKVGVIALVDDAAGFDKERFEYRQLFKEFLREQAAQYGHQIPEDLTDVFYKLYRYPNTHGRTQHPQFFGKLMRKYVYEPLAGSNGAILEMLDEKNPIIITKKGSRKRRFKFYQFLKVIGIDALQQHIWQLIGIGKASRDKAEFDKNFNATFSKNYQEKLFDRSE